MVVCNVIHCISSSLRGHGQGQQGAHGRRDTHVFPNINFTRRSESVARLAAGRTHCLRQHTARAAPVDALAESDEGSNRRVAQETEKGCVCNGAVRRTFGRETSRKRGGWDILVVGGCSCATACSSFLNKKRLKGRLVSREAIGCLHKLWSREQQCIDSSKKRASALFESDVLCKICKHRTLMLTSTAETAIEPPPRKAVSCLFFEAISAEDAPTLRTETKLIQQNLLNGPGRQPATPTLFIFVRSVHTYPCKLKTEPIVQFARLPSPTLQPAPTCPCHRPK